MGIVGYGWLGRQLGESLSNDGISVWGTVTRGAILRQTDIPLTDYLANGRFALPSADVAVITIPFRKKMVNPEDYADQIVTAAECARHSGATYVIWTGSTAIYPGSAKNVTEVTPFIPDNERQIVLAAIEARLAAMPISTLSVRLGGLFGPDRLIVTNFIPGVARPDGPVNLLHQSDAVRVLSWCVMNRPTGKLNAVATEHPLRSELYPQWADRLGIEIPEFGLVTLEKIVKSNRLELEFGIKLEYPDPRNWVGAPCLT